MKSQGRKWEDVARAERAVVKAAIRLADSWVAADFDTLRAAVYRLSELRMKAKAKK